MTWAVEYTSEASADLSELDRSQQIQVLKATRKVAENPLPSTEGGYGKPLGSHAARRLAGYLKIKLLKLGIRIVYRLVREHDTMRIIVIGVRQDEQVYRMLEDRIKKRKI